METEVVVALVGGGFGLAGTIGGTLLGMYVNGRSAVRTALQLASVEQHKFAQTRIWDAKKEVFTQIISELNGLEMAVESLASILFDPDVDPSPYIHSGDYSTAFGNMWRVTTKTDRLIADNSLILSDEFQSQYAQWHGEFFNYNEDTSEREISIIMSKALSTFKPRMVYMAKSELEAKPKD